MLEQDKNENVEVLLNNNDMTNVIPDEIVLNDNKSKELENDINSDKNIELNKKNTNKKRKKIIAIVIAILLIIGAVIYYFYFNSNKNNQSNNIETESNKVTSPYRMTSNSIEDFDLSFLKLENENKVYSPISIKYALQMLSEGASSETKDQIDAIIGDYSNNNYTNSKNMSFANALFVRDSFKENINEEYINNINSKYNALVLYDDFTNTTNINNWISQQTFDMIDNIVDSVEDNDFILVNALAIDMEWVNKLQALYDRYEINYPHERYDHFIGEFLNENYKSLKFNNDTINAKAVEIAADINKYNLVQEIGENIIRREVGTSYVEWLGEGACGNPQDEPDVNTYLDKYIEDVNSNYNRIDSSTDFSFYVDDNVKAFSKDLKEYNGTKLQYIGIMPEIDSLDSYIDKLDTNTINSLISNMKSINLSNFEEGKITKISGLVPMFSFNYDLNLLEDLKSLGITNVFDSSKADLSKLTGDAKSYISSVAHSSAIEFSNDGIKAAAATIAGGSGNTGCWFDYIYDVPVEEIDLSFNKPYLFLIRDVNSGEVWFTGTVYEPLLYTRNY